MHDTHIHRKSNTQLSEPSAALTQESCSAPTPDLFPTTPGRFICMATGGATRVDDDDDDDDKDAAAADDDDDSAFCSLSTVMSASRDIDHVPQDRPTPLCLISDQACHDRFTCPAA